MDLEKTVEFLLEQRGQFAANQAQIAANQVKTDRRVEALAILVRQGMRFLVERERRTQEQISSFVDAQRRTGHWDTGEPIPDY